ncbi:MAG TPA: hypothetical protein VLN46_01250 [Gillisia sp.]|nr:hypothetical protein [Gillisia sp.]
MQDLDFSKFTFIIRGMPEGRALTSQVSGATSSRDIRVGYAKLMEAAKSN